MNSNLRNIVEVFSSAGLFVEEEDLPDPNDYGLGSEHYFQEAILDAVIQSNDGVGFFLDGEFFEDFPKDYYKERIMELFQLVQADFSPKYINSAFDDNLMVETVKCGIGETEYVWSVSHQESYVNTDIVEEVIALINDQISKGWQLLIHLGGEQAPILYLPIKAIEALYLFDNKNQRAIDSLRDGELINIEGKSPYYRFNVEKGKFHGVQRIFYDSSEKLYSEINMVGGIANGKYRAFYPNGGLQFEVSLVDGKWHGEFLCYWDSGEIVTRFNYDMAVRHGRQVFLSRSGEILFEGHYDQGVRNGKFLFTKQGEGIMLFVNVEAGVALKDGNFEMSPKLGVFEDVDRALSIIEEERFQPPSIANLYQTEQLIKIINKARENNNAE